MMPDIALPHGRVLRAFGARHLPSTHPIYDTVAQSYPGFFAWLDKVRAENRSCWGAFAGDRLDGLAIMADREPGVRKICCFCLAPGLSGTGQGRAFITALMAAEKAAGTTRLCGDVLIANTAIRRFFRRHGFDETPAPDKPGSVAIARPL